MKVKSIVFFFVALVISSSVFAKAVVVESPNYHMTTSDKHKFVWFRVAKVATRSIRQVLANNIVQLSIDDYDVNYNPAKYRDYFKFAFVRNPWDRVVSCYVSQVEGKCHPAFKECDGKGFDFFVDFINKQDLSNADAYIRLQTCLFPLDEVDFVGRLENFAEDLKLVTDTLGLKLEEIPKKNSTQRPHYSHYYNEKTMRIIAEKYKKDIKAFDYEFESE